MRMLNFFRNYFFQCVVLYVCNTCWVHFSLLCRVQTYILHLLLRIYSLFWDHTYLTFAVSGGQKMGATLMLTQGRWGGHNTSETVSQDQVISFLHSDTSFYITCNITWQSTPQYAHFWENSALRNPCHWDCSNISSNTNSHTYL